MITHQKAQDIMLAVMGLHQRSTAPATKEDVLKTIQKMGMLQIDTISVVARSPYLVMWSRLGHYQPEWLDELLAEGHLFEGWSHAACFLPKEAYPLIRYMGLESISERWQPWIEKNTELVDRVRSVIREKGTVKSSHFERPKDNPSGWWNWKDEKIALEALFYTGEVMIARREKFQRVYAMRESVLPEWSDEKIPPKETVYRQFILNTAKAVGIVTPSWIPDYYRILKTQAADFIQALIEEGQLQAVHVEGWEETAYMHPDNAYLLEQEINPKLTTFLSPFDPLVWDRKRASSMFNFEYQIECYTPAPKRIYGYFTLPILSGRRLVGRMDAKAHRKEKRFEVKALHLEPNIEMTDELARDIVQALRECAAWHQTPEIEVTLCNPPEFKGFLLGQL